MARPDGLCVRDQWPSSHAAGIADHALNLGAAFGATA
jgi:hypothetical protein